MPVTERRERRTISRVPLAGTHTVRTHDGVEARLLDLSLRGARVEHLGILRPGSLCRLELPADLGALLLSAQILWCTILGAEWRSDGERHLRSHSGLWFTKMTEPQRTALTGILRQLSSGGPSQPGHHPGKADPSLDLPRLIPWPVDAALLPGTNGGKASGTPAGLVVISGMQTEPNLSI